MPTDLEKESQLSRADRWLADAIDPSAEQEDDEKDAQEDQKEEDDAECS